jgi:hypothetical protein
MSDLTHQFLDLSPIPISAERTSFRALIRHTPHVASPIPASATMVLLLQFAGRDHHPPIYWKYIKGAEQIETGDGRRV